MEYYICPVVIPSRCGNHKVFINSLLPSMQLNPDILKFDDDSQITDELMEELNGIADKISTSICWNQGDILMIDNTRIMHARRAFTDETREIYIRLCSPGFQF